jgi:hypothetical protein
VKKLGLDLSFHGQEIPMPPASDHCRLRPTERGTLVFQYGWWKCTFRVGVSCYIIDLCPIVDCASKNEFFELYPFHKSQKLAAYCDERSVITRGYGLLTSSCGLTISGSNHCQNQETNLPEIAAQHQTNLQVQTHSHSFGTSDLNTQAPRHHQREFPVRPPLRSTETREAYLNWADHGCQSVVATGKVPVQAVNCLIFRSPSTDHRNSALRR